MGITASVNATFGRSTSSYARKVLAQIATATKESTFESCASYEIRKDALDGSLDTPLPITFDFGSIELMTCLVVRVVNSALLQLTTLYDPGTGEVPEAVYLPLGTTDHPEGLYVFMGEKKIQSLTVEDVYADRTLVEIWAFGNAIT